MVFCCNRLEEIGNYKKVRSVYGDNKDTYEGKWKIKDSLDQGGK